MNFHKLLKFYWIAGFIVLSTSGECHNFPSSWEKNILPPYWSQSILLEKKYNAKYGVEQLGKICFTISKHGSAGFISFCIFSKAQQVGSDHIEMYKDALSLLKTFYFQNEYYVLDTVSRFEDSLRSDQLSFLFRLQEFILSNNVQEQEKMSITNWITIITALVIVVGWFINSALQRLHERAKERLKYRMEALKSCLVILFLAEESDTFHWEKNFNSILEVARKNLLAYGKAAEIESFQLFVKDIKDDKITSAKDRLDDLISLIKGSIRNELKIR
jgi:hypothetical protein